MKAFKAYDIRGVWERDFNEDDCYLIGYYLPDLLKTDKILIGRDVRHSSPAIHNALTRGLIDRGVHIIDIGISTTPMVYFAAASLEVIGSVQITASHNPSHYNGMKVSGKDSMPIGYDEGLKHLEQLIQEKPPRKSSKKGFIEVIDFTQEYLSFLKSYKKDQSDLKISMDCSNGMAGLLVNEIYGEGINLINEKLDGSFPNHEPNPLEEENLIQLKAEVLKHKSDIGVIFDGDADRVMFIDDKGQFVQPDLIIALLGHHFLKTKNQIVLQDIRSSKSVTEYLKQFGAKTEMWRVGRAYAVPKLKQIGGIYGGELAGHYYFKDFFYSDSGILASILVLNIVHQFKAEGVSFSALISRIKKYENSGEINFKIEKKLQAMNAVKEHFFAQEEPEAFYDFDGYRLDYKDFWLNIRPSNTEPYLRFIAEANSKELLEEVLEQSKEIIEGFR